MITVLFACVHNAGRSQIAAAWLNNLADSSQARALSAGTDPAACVHPEVLLVMREVGIELKDVRPQLLSPSVAAQASHLITMGCGDACPFVPGVMYEDWKLADPKGKPLDEVRQMRDTIKALVLDFLAARKIRLR